ncbi:MAG: TRAP transporter large permease subunit, partial [Spirochaetales bacterium]|nr:TRAP transporter large permease subunit [Spirochaetales bacterium]
MIEIFTNPLFPVALLFILFFLDVPIALSLIGSSLYYFTFINTAIPMRMVIQQFVTAIESFPYLAVPFFIMLGSVMNYSGISEKLMDMAEVLAGHLKGGLAQVNCLLSALMGGISGSANADAAMESKILVPEMLKKGLPLDFSAAVTAASSAVSPVIPPGNNLILYALIANISVGDMFLAGYTPGILMTAALMITVYIISSIKGYAPSRDRRARAKEIVLQIAKSIWALVIPFVIILGMRLGICTPTEAGGIAVFFAIF